MLLRLLSLFVFAAASVILVASPARAAPEKVQYTGDAKPGTIVVQSGERSLYLITGKDQALKYSVGVGRSGQQWFGTTRIASKHIRPAWKPPASLRGKRSPDFYIEAGSPRNPMGAAALVLVDNELAIHGTNNPGSVGGLVSAGCIRMQHHAVPATYSSHENPEDGGLMSYGTNVTDAFLSDRNLYRPHPQGREARGPAGRAVEQVRAGYQRPDGQDTRPPSVAVAALDRRRDNRIKGFCYGA